MADGLRLRKVADRSKEPAADGTAPLAGVRILGDPPVHPSPSTALVDGGVREGWIVREGEKPVVRPGGPLSNRWATSHTFMHADTLVFRTLDGDVRYRVVGQPDKYGPDGRPVEDYAGVDLADCDVRWFYQLELEG